MNRSQVKIPRNIPRFPLLAKLNYPYNKKTSQTPSISLHLSVSIWAEDQFEASRLHEPVVGELGPGVIWCGPY
ncbi:hypothetical protein ES703_25725 [subsurface metagenome]